MILFICAMLVSAGLSSALIFAWRSLVSLYWMSLLDTPLYGLVWCYQRPMLLAAICCGAAVVITLQAGRWLKLA